MLIRASWDFILFGSRPVLLPRHSCLEMQVKHKPVFESDQQKHKPVLKLSSFYYSNLVASGNVAMNGRHNKELWNLDKFKKERLFEFWFTSVLFITFAEQSRCRLLTPFISVCSDSLDLCVSKVNCLDTLAWMGRQNTTSIIIIFSIIIITIRCLCMNGAGRQNDATFHNAWVCVSASTEWSRP